MKNPRRAFTLIEVLVASAVLILILGFLLAAVNQTSRVWRRSSDTIDAFQSARDAFDLITRRLSTATLGTYWDYQYDMSGFPRSYRRESDLQFKCDPPGVAGTSGSIFFQTYDGYTKDPANYGGMSGLLNDCGFYIAYSGDADWRPPPAAGLEESHRYRLMQRVLPTEDMASIKKETGWNNPAPEDVPVGENIIAMVFRPARSSRDAAAAFPGGFSYDSRQGATTDPQPETANQLPPLVEVAMVAIDTKSAQRLAGASEPPVITGALNGKFLDPDDLDDDLKAIVDDLADAGVTARVFRTMVPIHASRWSD